MAKQHPPAFLALVGDAKQRVRETTIPDLKKRLDAKEELHLIDVREDHEWAAGHIPGAIHLSKGIIERDIESQIPDREAEILLYCGGGYRSALVADNLQKMGYKRVVSVDGGWRAWTGAGFPVEKPEA
ncbi:MAG: rhodanese-like domain-containing protein [Terriglobia bacterium]|jgi:rhodanese-related sulfurtransferase